MERSELAGYLEDYREENSRHGLIQFLKDRLVEELEDVEADSGSQKHNLNLLIRELEEKLHYIESEKLSEYDPEQQ